MIDLIFAFGEIVFIISYFFRNMLFLRILTNVGIALFITAGLIAGYEAAGMKALVLFNTISFLINSYRITQIINEKNLFLIPEYYKSIYQKDFSMMSPAHFLKLKKLASLDKLPIHSVLTEQGQHVGYLMLIIKGTVKVIINNKVQTILGPDFYIGEMSFLSGDVATGTVVANEDLELMQWDKIALSKLEHDDPGLYHNLTISIANNLITKVKHQAFIQPDL